MVTRSKSLESRGRGGGVDEFRPFGAEKGMWRFSYPAETNKTPQ